MVLVAINKTGAPVNAALALAAYGTYSTAKVYQLTSAGPNVNAAGSITATAKNAFNYTMPAYSVSVIVPE